MLKNKKCNVLVAVVGIIGVIVLIVLVFSTSRSEVNEMIRAQFALQNAAMDQKISNVEKTLRQQMDEVKEEVIVLRTLINQEKIAEKEWKERVDVLMKQHILLPMHEENQ